MLLEDIFFIFLPSQFSMCFINWEEKYTIQQNYGTVFKKPELSNKFFLEWNIPTEYFLEPLVFWAPRGFRPLGIWAPSQASSPSGSWIYISALNLLQSKGRHHPWCQKGLWFCPLIDSHTSIAMEQRVSHFWVLTLHKVHLVREDCKWAYEKSSVWVHSQFSYLVPHTAVFKCSQPLGQFC